ncbi:P-type DNA transfer protein VirB5 [Brucella tritici]|uniref:P-type DNA transfer protein VirB5 n=1 Tax=Brucella/Ochrobactrum group TaxID=2826938 RepID=UPI001591FBDF|nr:P-type DNA transfer protein VirB5 [Brucella tritici]MCH4539798.1 P-type DNA transfer protein VirB5 [Ochrobactrum sp. A-1]
MASYRRFCAMMATVLTLSTGAAMGQGIPVIDQTAIAKHLESIAQLKSQLDVLHQQIEKAEELYTSFNKLTDMADVAQVLNDPAIRKALPPEFAAVEGLFEGNGSGALNDAATKFLDKNTTYKTSADDFYANELSRVQNKNAGQMGIGQKIYDAATKRIEGIDELRQKVSTASEAKEIADLQARLLAEQAFVQTDVLRMEGLRMVQQAQTQVDDQRKAEDWRRRMDAMKGALK